MTQHIYCWMIVTKLIKQYSLMLMENLLGAEKKRKEIQDARKNICLGEAEEAALQNRDDNEPQLLREIMDAVNEIVFMNNNVPNLTLDQRVAMLHSEQKRIL